ncbi:MAG: hypothetical protein Ct9H300mP14_11460 [Gammaproteobacteria bacterium]|nr:MAG: hypothetical protein Ct9H300mP14_11460 [Gammaproteobacteria bacterium]
MCVCRLRVDQTCMLIIMAVNAQIFPIAAMGWIVVVIMILVMYGQFMKVLLIELAPAAAADPWMDLERLGAIALFSRSRARIASITGPFRVSFPGYPYKIFSKAAYRLVIQSSNCSQGKQCTSPVRFVDRIFNMKVLQVFTS